MASRLSEESLKASHDVGLGGLAVINDPALDKTADARVDLDALLEAEDPLVAVQAVSPQAIYQAILKRGPEDCIEVLPLLSEEQVTRIFDYDAWTDDRIAPLRAVRWLNLFKEVGPEELVRRFRELDEEFQIGMLGPLLEMFDEDEYEKLSDDKQDQLHRMPCNTVFYLIKTEDTRIVEFITGLLEDTAGVDMNYGYALLAHAALLPPNESESQEAQFRKARLEEDGFVSFEESLGVFRPVDLDALTRRFQFELGRDPALVAKKANDTRPFLTRVLADAGQKLEPEQAEALQQGLAFLGNMLASAVRIQPDDQIGLRNLLLQARALTSLGLEFLAGGDLATGKQILVAEHPQVLFRAGLSLVARLAGAVVDRLAAHRLPGHEKIKEAFLLEKRGLVLVNLEQKLQGVVGFERLEALKGLFSRFPVRPKKFYPDTDGVQRVEFQPISSVDSLRALAGTIDGITGLLHLAALADDDRLVEQSLDRRLTTALARVLLGGEFRAEELTESDLGKLADVSQETAQMLVADFFAGVEGTLRMALLPAPEGVAWAASRASGVVSTGPVQAVLSELSDLVFGLMAARSNSAALKNLVIMRNKA